jgi:hypothetical protein
MAYPYQIKTMQQYKRARQDSLADPEAFWADLAQHFSWMRSWLRDDAYAQTNGLGNPLYFNVSLNLVSP